MDGVKRAIERILNGDKIKPARLSLSLEQPVNTRLEYVIDKLGTTKQKFIETAVDGVLYDVEMRLGLRKKDEYHLNERGEKFHLATPEYISELIVMVETKAKESTTASD